MPASRAAATVVGDVRRAVTPAERPELVGLEALGADRDPRDPGPRQAGEVSPVVGPRVRLERDLRAGRDPVAGPDLVEQPGDCLGGQQRRRPAAEVDRLEARPRGASGRPERGVERVRAQVELDRDGAQVPGDATARTHGGGAGHDHEVAVRAERTAEGDVDVQRDRGRGRRPVAARHRSARASSPGRLRLPPSVGRSSVLPGILGLVAARRRLAGVAGAHEDGDPGDRVPQECRADPAGDRGQPARGEPHPQREGEDVGAAARGGRARCEHVEQGLGDDREGRIDAGQEKEAQDEATEGCLVDERGPERVEQGVRIRPEWRHPQPGVAASREEHRLPRPDGPERETAEDRAGPIAEPEQEVAGGRRVDDQGRDDQGEPEHIPAHPKAERARPSVRGRLVVLRGPERGGLEAQEAQQACDAERHESAEQLLHRTAAAPSWSRPCAGRRGRPPAGSPPIRRASCAACLPSASPAASASA